MDREGTLPSRVVTLTTKPRGVEDALKQLCRAAERYWWKDADGIYMISNQPPREAERAVENAVAAPQTAQAIPRAP